jgi:hypothetical protein
MDACLKPLDIKLQIIRRRCEEARRDGSASDIGRAFLELRQLADEVSGIWSGIKGLRDQMAYEWVPEKFESEGVSTTTLKEGYRVTISALVRASTRDMEKGILWMRENGYSDIVKETISASTLAALAKDLAQEGKELPDSHFNVFFGSNTSLTKV